MAVFGAAALAWQMRPLGDLVTTGGGQLDPSQTPDVSYNYLSLDNIEAGTGRIIGFAPRRGREIGSVKNSFKRGDLLYCRLRPYLQKVAIAPFDGVTTTDVWPMRTIETIDAEYLREVLLGPQHLDQVTQLMSGARMPRVRSDDLLRIEIPVPPVTEQRLIVRALRVISYRATIIRRKLELGLALADDYEASLLDAAYRGELSAPLRENVEHKDDGLSLLTRVLSTRRLKWEEAEQDRLSAADRPHNDRWKDRYAEPVLHDETETTSLPRGWTWASLAQLTSAASPISYGVVETGDEVEDGIRLIRTQDLENGTVSLDRMRYIAPHVDEAYPRSRVTGGEVLASLVGTIGRIAIVPEKLRGANINRALAKLTPAAEVPSAWLAYALETPRLQDWMSRGSRGVARNILNLSLLAQAPIPLAPETEMAWLIPAIELRRASIRSLRQQLTDAISATTAFVANVKVNAFEGKLAAKDPSDHLVAIATSELLETKLLSESERVGRPKVLKRTKLRGDRLATKRDLTAVLKEYPDGLGPLRLLEEAGYTIEEVETFYKALAVAVDDQHIREDRPDFNSARLVAI